MRQKVRKENIQNILKRAECVATMQTGSTNSKAQLEGIKCRKHGLYICYFSHSALRHI